MNDFVTDANPKYVFAVTGSSASTSRKPNNPSYRTPFELTARTARPGMSYESANAFNRFVIFSVSIALSAYPICTYIQSEKAFAFSHLNLFGLFCLNLTANRLLVHHARSTGSLPRRDRFRPSRCESRERVRAQYGRCLASGLNRQRRTLGSHHRK